MKNVQLSSAKAGCLIRIKSAISLLKPAERSIAEYVVAHPDKVIYMSVSELGREVEVGDSTVIRFCRTLGYEGYQEFKLRLAQDLVEPAKFIHEKVGFKDSPADLVQKIFQANLSAVESTQRALDPTMVDKAARLITASSRLELFGSGYSAYAALDAKSKFLRLGLVADAFADGHMQAMAASGLGKNAVAIGISHTGSSRDVVDALNIARSNGASTIAITNFSPSPVTKGVDAVLLTASSETPFGGEVLSSRIAQLCVIDVIAVATAIRLGERCLEYIHRASEAVKNKRY